MAPLYECIVGFGAKNCIRKGITEDGMGSSFAGTRVLCTL